MQWDSLEKQISNAIGKPFKIDIKRSIGGGSINDAYMISDGELQLFAKFNAPDQREMFDAEAEGLLELNKPAAIKVPKAICWGSAGQSSFIVMDYIEQGGRGSQNLLGEQLANLHRFTNSQFGWFRNNTIGSTPQSNTPSNNWVEFLRDQRLGFQLDLAARKGYTGRLQKNGEKLLAELETFFQSYSPQPSLLHGDLWSGNYSFDTQGNPVIFDPAVYYGDREADIAMTELFGGFGGDFYSAYNQSFPLHEDYSVRKTLYNLYHIINHLNLFGSGYHGQAESMISRLLAEIR